MTVMQEFADKLEQMAIIREQEGSACAGVWNTIHHWATQMLDKEKEQRERDFKSGNDSACMEHEDIKDYFDKYIKSE